MMLHEAVMLEIYRQALSASELASPRCQSRESNTSLSNAPEGRCPSNESHCSGNEGSSASAQTPTPNTPPVGLPLPATLAPAAAAALLPPQSAAMAAYLNAAAAAAAQQNHLLLTNPLAAAATLVQQATQASQAHSPSSRQTTSPPSSGDLADGSALDFSTKRSRRHSDGANGSEDDGNEERNDNEPDNDINNADADDANSPLDLSLNARRKRQSDEDESPIMPTSKMQRSSDYKTLPSSSTWVPPINPYLAAVAAASMSPKAPLTLDWNSKPKISPNEATKALEKMTEMTRIGTASNENEMQSRHSTAGSSIATSTTTATTSTTTNGRHSAWQSHWLNKGADAVRDVFKCVWCKQSFATLASLTTHMKETQHCGVNIPPTVATSSSNGSNSCPTNSGGVNNQPVSQASSHHSRLSASQGSALNGNSNAMTSGNKSDLNMLIKETMPLPRKLVRGQDVWLGKGAEQTRQILKCMWCGQSFRSLAEMTNHMQETQHYTNIISQEQIISWKSSDEKSSRDNSSSRGHSNASPNVTTPNPGSSNSTISAVLTCKVCDQAFPTLKELSNHMVKNNHYKEHMMRTTAANNEPMPTMVRGRGRQTKEKRKKSLPVRKLLEMERAQQDFKSSGLDQALKPLRDFAASTKITCEKCGEKIETALFVDHIRQCIGGSVTISPRNNHHNNHNNKANHNLKTFEKSYGNGRAENLNSPQTVSSRKMSEGRISPLNTTRSDILCPLPSDNEKHTEGSSVLNALEQLIEKSFDTRPRHSGACAESSSTNATSLGSSILKRLGIDDNVDYTKPLMDPQTMQFLRSYSSYPTIRDRSASESSSISERCSSRLESFTPERNSELSRQPTPRLTPDKNMTYPKDIRAESLDNVQIKSEPVETNDLESRQPDEIPVNEIPKKISVKKEFTMIEGSLEKFNEADTRRYTATPFSRAMSPSVSERSITPKSTSSVNEKKPSLLPPTESSSLIALSSMFNSLSNTSTNLNCAALEININSHHNNNSHSNNSTSKKVNANPLAALQKLCETADPPAANTRSTSNNLLSNSNALSSGVQVSNGGGSGASTGMLAFSWACNDAIVTADAIIKCSFCDTPFSSKGAYRHHLSKVHFVKEETDISAGVAGVGGGLKSPGTLTAASPKSMNSPKSVASSSAKSPATQRLDITPPSSSTSTPTINPYDESPQSKFLKYTELAKQLSSKNA
uniref:C2H2-type domain-containing protein n=1 Tax=Glossina brevipalpis TaxID=37001 RepID=A0A1A9WXB3_9MUSC